MSLLRSLSNDALIDILICCSDDLQSVMNFAMTCSEFYQIMNECSERFWIFKIRKMIDERMSKTLRIGFKSETLSILENNMKMDKTKQLISIIRTQVRYDRKRQLLAEYKRLRMIKKYYYFAKQVEIKDKYLRKIMEKEIVESLAYSPENIIKEKFDNNVIGIIAMHLRTNFFTMSEFIDALFRKQDAHLYLDVHNRTMSSCLYDYWKEEYRKKSTVINNSLIWFRSATGICGDLDSCLLFLKLMYLEFPNLKGSSPSYYDIVEKTAYEEDKEPKTRGSFKLVMRNMMNGCRHEIFNQACQIFATEVYGDADSSLKLRINLYI